MPYPTGDSLSLCRRIVLDLPDDDVFMRAFVGQLSILGIPSSWETVGSVTAENAATFYDSLVQDLETVLCEDSVKQLPAVAIWGHYLGANGNAGAVVAGTIYPRQFPDQFLVLAPVTQDEDEIVFHCSAGWWHVHAECANATTDVSRVFIINDDSEDLIMEGLWTNENIATVDGWFYLASGSVGIRIDQQWRISDSNGKGNTPGTTYGGYIARVVFEWSPEYPQTS